MPQPQVKHSYGAKPNEDFLQYYGFVDTENVNDAYTADVLQWVTQHHQLEPERVQALEKDVPALKALQQVLSQTLLTAAIALVPLLRTSG